MRWCVCVFFSFLLFVGKKASFCTVAKFTIMLSDDEYNCSEYSYSKLLTWRFFLSERKWEIKLIYFLYLQGQTAIGKLPADDHLRKMFLGGLSPNSTEESVRAYYSQFGEVIDVIIMRDPTTKRSRGFGFITFNDASMVDRAQASRPHIVDGK